MDSDSDGEDFETEVEEIETKTLGKLKEGKLPVLNSDGTFRCPFSPSKKKQSYKFSEILQHAEGAGKGKRGIDAAGKHRALAKHLKEDHKERARPQAERTLYLDQPLPCRVEKPKLVVPHMGILLNIKNTDIRVSDGFRQGPGQGEIRDKFKVFNPQFVDIFYDQRGHLGCGVITFHTFEDAEAFEHSFKLAHCGREDYIRDLRLNKLGSRLYGWHATEEDHKNEDQLLHWKIPEFLGIKGDFKNLKIMIHEEKRLMKQQVHQLKSEVAKHRSDVLDSKFELAGVKNRLEDIENKRREAEQENAALVERHKAELEELRAKQVLSGQEHRRLMWDYNRRQAEKMKLLQAKCEDYERNEQAQKQESEAERQRLEAEKQEALRQMQQLTEQAKAQEKLQQDQLELIKKHKQETEAMEMRMQAERTMLAKKQESELQSQRVVEKLEVEKGEVGKNDEEQQKKIKELQEELASIQEDLELQNGMVNVLNSKHMTTNDELQDAKKAAVVLLKKYTADDKVKKVSIKRAGELRVEAWAGPFQKKFKNSKEGWQTHLAKVSSEWDSTLRTNEFHPLKTVQVGTDKWKEIIDDTDERLVKLRKEFGAAVCESVTTALKEIMTYNPSGRYIVEVPWNYVTDQEATMKDIVVQLGEIIRQKDTMKGPAKRKTPA